MFIHRITMEHLHKCVLNCHKHGKIRLEHPQQLGNLDMYMLECVLQNMHRGTVKCAIFMDTCVRNCMSMCVLLSRGGSSQQGCWRPRFAKLLKVNFRICNLDEKRTPSSCLLFCFGAVCDSPDAFETSKTPTCVDMEGCQ